MELADIVRVETALVAFEVFWPLAVGPLSYRASENEVLSSFVELVTQRVL